MMRTFVGLFAWLVFASIAQAEPSDGAKTEPPGTSIVKSLLFGEYWGANRDNVMSVIKDRFDTAWRARASELDAYEVDVEIRKAQERYQDVVASYTELDQNSSAYLASPLKGEFGLGLDQSLLRVKLKHGDRYFLFQSSRLAKIVEVVPASRFKSVGDFLTWQAKEMKIKSVPLCTAADIAQPKADTAFTVCALDKSRLFSAYLLRVNDPTTEWKKEQNRNEELDETAALPDIFTEDPDAEDNQELVDELTGAKKKKKAAPPKKVQKTKVIKKAVRKDEKGLSNDEDVLY